MKHENETSGLAMRSHHYRATRYLLLLKLATISTPLQLIPTIHAFSPSFQHVQIQCRNNLQPMSPITWLSTKVDPFMEQDNQTQTKARFINILCMHGKGNDGPSFESLTAPLQEALVTRMQKEDDSITLKWNFLSAPFTMVEDSKRKREWWRLPPNTRSFTAKEYIGFEESETLVMNALDDLEGQGEDGVHNFFLLLGHSQGAILLAALLAKRHDLERTNRGFILNGCALPNPYTEQLHSFQSTKLSGNGIPSKALFIIGEADSINPPEGAKQVRDCLEKGGMVVDTVYHDGGHAVPVRNEAAVEEIVDWIEGWIQSHPL